MSHHAGTLGLIDIDILPYTLRALSDRDTAHG